MEQLNDDKSINEVFIAQSKEEEIKAKLTELEQWKSRQVYKEVEDTGRRVYFTLLSNKIQNHQQ